MATISNAFSKNVVRATWYDEVLHQQIKDLLIELQTYVEAFIERGVVAWTLGQSIVYYSHLRCRLVFTLWHDVVGNEQFLGKVHLLRLLLLSLSPINP